MAQGRYSCTGKSAQLRGTAVYEFGELTGAQKKIEYCDRSGLFPTKLKLFVDFEAKAERKRLRNKQKL